jgi:hypothetical protein
LNNLQQMKLVMLPIAQNLRVGGKGALR